MQSYLFDRTHDTGTGEFQAYHFLINTLKHRFQTYGYDQMRTSTFEHYDLYHSVTGTVSKQHMVKVIDQSGDVVVMRPDVTIPITRMMSLSDAAESRLFYVLNVFRQYPESTELEERLQAGVERFGSDHPETDAEVITLAIHAIRDLGFSHFKVEIGHAGFFKEILHQLDLRQHETEQLQQLIQAKNLADIRPLLAAWNISDDMTRIIQTIPLLYGKPEDVLERAEQLPLTSDMKEKIDGLYEIYNLLEVFGVTEHIVFDLGLINHMDYYSDVIFQGFIEGYGHPVLMGGRYDNLGEQFGTTLPAIGFAYDIGSLLEALQQDNHALNQSPSIDISLFYDDDQTVPAIRCANYLRQAGYSVIMCPHQDHDASSEKSHCTAYFHEGRYRFYHQQTEQSFTDASSLEKLLYNALGGE